MWCKYHFKLLLITTLMVVACGFKTDNNFVGQKSLQTVKASEFLMRVGNNPEFQDVHPNIEEEKGKYFILFIPGILGSKLFNADGNAIWGGNEKPKAEKLSVTLGAQHAKAKILDEYPVLKIFRKDIYGQFDETLQNIAGGRFPVVEFPYDWRQDIEEIADKLELKIRKTWREKLKKKKLIIIAHSMGGLVAWAWKNKYYEKYYDEKDFELYRLILVGCPLKGNSEILRMLLKGYLPIPGDNPLEKYGYKYLFNELQAAALTFPSVFQMLPSFHDDCEKDCLIVRYKDAKDHQNHFYIEVWKRLLPKFFDFKKSIFINSDVFENNLNRLLKKAQSFRNKFNPSEEPITGRVYYFFSDDCPTTKQLNITRKRNKYTLKDVATEKGDGRVLRKSAINIGNSTLGNLIPISNNEGNLSHCDLINNEQFITYIRINLQTAIDQSTSRAMAKIILDNPAAKLAFERSNFMLTLGDAGINILDIGESGKALVALNRLKLPDWAVHQSLTGRAKQLTWEKDAPKHEIAILDGSLLPRAMTTALINYGRMAIQRKHYDVALPVILKAEMNYEENPKIYSDDFKKVIKILLSKFPQQRYGNLYRISTRQKSHEIRDQEIPSDTLELQKLPKLRYRVIQPSLFNLQKSSEISDQEIPPSSFEEQHPGQKSQ